MKRFAAAVLATALLLLARGPAEAQDKAPSTAYYPLEVGNTWYYKVGQNHFTIKVEKLEKIGKVLCARLEMTVGDKTKKARSFEHLAVHNGALCRFALDGKEAKPPIPFLKVPPKAGDKAWAIESKVGMQVVKGKFRPCKEEASLKLSTGLEYKKVFTVTSEELMVNGIEVKIAYSFAENIGLVKLEIGMEGQKIVYELERFERAEKAEKAKDKE